MAKIAFRQSMQSGKKVSMDLATQAASSAKPPDQNLHGITYSEHIKSILELYALCLTRLLRLRAALMDGRQAEAEILRKQCRDIVEALDDDLDRSVELAQNFHILYQHCLRHIGHPGDELSLENVDAVQMVVRRLRHLYVHLVRAEQDKAQE